MVDFIVIGAAKSATSSICDLLHQHPDLFICTPKEPNFFSHDDRWAKGESWYRQLFDHAPSNCLRGEGSTNYTKHILYPEAPNRVAQCVPDAKLIYIVRHPIERIESHWMFLRKSGWKTEFDINEAVISQAHLVDTSLYFRQIQFYLTKFPPENVHIMFFEDFKNDPQGVMNKVFSFLGVGQHAFIAGDLRTPRNPSLGQLGDTRILMQLRRTAGFRLAQHMLPKSVTRRLQTQLKTRLERPSWRSDVKSRLIEKLAADAARFLELANRPADMWDWY